MRHILRAAVIAAPLLTALGTGHHVSAYSVTATINAVGHGPVDVAFSPDGSRAYVTNNLAASVSVIDTANDTVLTTIPVGAAPNGVAVSSTKVLVNNTAAPGNPAAVIDRSSNAVSYITTSLPSGGEGIALSSDGNTAYMVGGDRFARIDLTTNNVTYSAAAPMSYTELVIPPSGNYGYVTSYNSGTITKFDLSTLAVVNTLTPGFGLIGATITPDGSKIYVALCLGGVLVYDTATDTVTNTIAVAGCPFGIDITPDGSQVFVSRHSAGKVSVIDTSTDQVAEEIPVGSHPRGLEVSPDGSKVYVTNSDDNTVSVIGLTVPPTTTTTAAPTTTATPSTTAAPLGVPATTSAPTTTTAATLPVTGRRNEPAIALPVIAVGLVAFLAATRRRRPLDSA